MLSLNIATQGALNDGLPFAIAHLVQCNFTTSIARMCDYHHDLTWGGFTWDSESVLGISQLIDDGENTAQGFSVTFGPRMLTTVLNEALDGRTMLVYMALVRSGSILGDPLVMARGEMSPDWINEDPSQLSVIIRGENLWIDQFDNLLYARTAAGQKERFPSDDGLDSIAQMQNVSLDFPGSGTHYFR